MRKAAKLAQHFLNRIWQHSERCYGRNRRGRVGLVVPPAKRDGTTWGAIAQAKEALGDAGGAVAADRQAIPRDPRAREPRRHLVEMLRRAGRTAEAKDEERRLVALAPADFRAQVELAERLARGGEVGQEKMS